MILLYFTTESGGAKVTFLTVAGKNLSTIENYVQKESKSISKKLGVEIKGWRKWSPKSGKEKVTSVYATEVATELGNPPQSPLLLIQNVEV